MTVTAPSNRIWPALPTPAFLIDGQDRICGMNPSAETFLNAARRSCSGRPISDCLAINAALLGNIARARNGQSVLFEYDVSLDMGRDQPVLCDIQIAPLGDVSETMLMLVHPRRIKRQLGKALQAKSAAKSAIGLADMLAHEIKNPLAGITGAAQLLAMGLGKEDQEMTDLILQETRRIVDLLKQVERFGDLRAPRLRVVNIHDLLERARRSASLGTASKMVFQDDYDPSLPATLADGDLLMQVFANLFANAAEAAGPDGGTITIRTYYEVGLRLRSGDGGHAVPLQIEIRDDGPGIPASMIDSVFDPFVSTRDNGTGLGLALVSKIIAEHRGTIVATSRPGKTIFRISLPIAPNMEGNS